MPKESEDTHAPSEKTIDQLQADYDQACKELGHFAYQADVFVAFMNQVKEKINTIARDHADAVSKKNLENKKMETENPISPPTDTL